MTSFIGWVFKKNAFCIGEDQSSIVWSIRETLFTLLTPKTNSMNQDQYTVLLYKNLSGDIDEQEKQLLDRWLAESPDHQLIAQSVAEAWQLSGNYTSDIAIDLDAEFAFLESRIEAAETPAKPTKAKVVTMPSSRSKWLKVAAAVLFLIAAGVVFQYFSTQNPPSAQWTSLKTRPHQTQHFTLADGSKVWVNENSIVEYPTVFEGAERRIKLSGEAFFDVTKNPEKPFIIETQQAAVTVLGTSFNVNAYAENEQVTVAVKSGKVQLAAAKDGQKLVLQANEKGILDFNSHTLQQISDANLNDLAWQSRKLRFKDTPLKTVLADIATYYEIDIELSNHAMMSNCPFSNTLDSKGLTDALNAVAGVFGMEVEQLGKDKYRLNGGTCGL